MKGKTITLVVLFLLLCLSINPMLSSAKTDIKTLGKNSILYVGGSGPGNFSSVHDAYSNCTDGDTIFIYNGIYVWPPHSHISVHKNNITFCGENMMETIMDGQEKLEDNYYFYVNGSNVTFRNLYFRKPEKERIADGPRFILSRGKKTQVEYCYFDSSIAGVLFFNTFVFKNNVVEETSLAYGLHFTTFNSTEEDAYLVENNTFYCGLYAHGEYDEFSLYNVCLVNNSFYGGHIRIDYIKNLNIVKNSFYDVESIDIGWDDQIQDLQNFNVLVENNYFYCSTHWNSLETTVGLYLSCSFNITLCNNIFEGCGESLYIWECEDVEIYGNQIIGGGKYGITLNHQIDDIKIFENNIDCSYLPVSFFLHEYNKDDFSISNNYYSNRLLKIKILWGWCYAPLSLLGRRIVFRIDRNSADTPFDIPTEVKTTIKN